MVEYFEKNFIKLIENEGFRKMIASNKISTEYQKIIIEKKSNKQELFFQITLHTKAQVFHENFYDTQKLYFRFKDLIELKYKQIDFLYTTHNDKFLINKKGNYKLITSNKNKAQENINSHNKIKNYIFEEGVVRPWLVYLEIMDEKGNVFKNKQKKFRQINKFLELMQKPLSELPKNPKIIDFGCGKSYLTFAMYDYLVSQGYEPIIVGLDLKKDVVDYCNELAKKFEFKDLKFLNQDVRDFKKDEEIDMIISLHACDIATDYALYAGIVLNAKVIMSVPCCHSELFQKIKNKNLNHILQYGSLKEQFASMLTDSIRGLLLEEAGYDVNIYEFIDVSHTPKNTMIQAIKTNKKINKEKIRKEINQVLIDFDVTQTLNELMKEVTDEHFSN